MQVETIPIAELTLDPKNARKHPVKNLQAIKNSLKKFGQQKPVVIDADGVVIAGNGTVEAARWLGWTEILAVRSQLAGADATAYGIADNQTGESSEWDNQQLQSLIEELNSQEFDLTALGFESRELDVILKADWSNPIPDEHSAKNARPIAVTPAQRETIDRAIGAMQDRIKEDGGDGAVTEGRALELVCADWLS